MGNLEGRIPGPSHTQDAIERTVHRRMMLSDIERLRKDEARLLRRADDLFKEARMIRSEADGIVKNLAAFDRGGH